VPQELMEIEAADATARPGGSLDAAFVDRDGGAVVERQARDDLRRQIATLERRLGELFASAFPRKGIDWSVGAVGGPRLLGTAELERVRDALAVRLRDAQAELDRRGGVEEANRGLLESMIAEPEHYRWVRISGEEVGEPGCRHWHSRPRWGILGMLMGWWRVKLSSGCPLAQGPRPLQMGDPTTSRARVTRVALRISSSSGARVPLARVAPCVLDLLVHARPRAHAAVASTI
jgi:hypothetical protein